MKSNTNTQSRIPQPEKHSAGSSKTGAVLSILALILSAMGSALVHSKWKAAEPVTTAGEKVGEAIGSGTWRVLATIFSVPFLVGAIGLALLAIVLIIIKLRKVKAGGFVTSALWIIISVWAIKISAAAFQIISAHPSN